MPVVGPCAVSELPDELLNDILSDFTVYQLHEWRLVSRKWRDVIHEHPTYWRDLVFKESPEMQPFLIARLARARDRPIGVRLYHRATSGKMFDLVIQHMHHIQSLDIVFDVDVATRYFFGLARTCAAPILEDLTLVANEPPSLALPSDLFQGSLPSLRKLKLVNISLSLQNTSFLQNAQVVMYHLRGDGSMTDLNGLAAACPRAISVTLSGNFTPLPSHAWQRGLRDLLQRVYSDSEAASASEVVRPMLARINSWRIEAKEVKDPTGTWDAMFTVDGDLSLTIRQWGYQVLLAADRCSRIYIFNSYKSPWLANSLLTISEYSFLQRIGTLTVHTGVWTSFWGAAEPLDLAAVRTLKLVLTKEAPKLADLWATRRLNQIERLVLRVQGCLHLRITIPEVEEFVQTKLLGAALPLEVAVASPLIFKTDQAARSEVICLVD